LRFYPRPFIAQVFGRLDSFPYCVHAFLTIPFFYFDFSLFPQPSCERPHYHRPLFSPCPPRAPRLPTTFSTVTSAFFSFLPFSSATTSARRPALAVFFFDPEIRLCLFFILEWLSPGQNTTPNFFFLKVAGARQPGRAALFFNFGPQAAFFVWFSELNVPPHKAQTKRNKES